VPVATLADPTLQVVPWTAFLAAHEAEWMALWQRTGAAPDLSPMWLQALVVAHAIEPRQLHVVHSRAADGSLQLVWPVQVQNRAVARVPVVEIAPVQNIFCMHAGLLTSLPPGPAVQQLMQALRRWTQPWHWLELNDLIAGSPLHEAWQAVSRTGRHGLRLQPGDRPPYIAHEGTLDDLIAAGSKRFRKKARGLLREVREGGGVRVQWYREPHELAQYQQLALAIEARSWKHAAGSAISSRAWEAEFYTQLIRRLGPLGMLGGTVLFLDGQPAAHSLELLHGTRMSGLKSSFDHALARRSPGHLLLVHVLDICFSSGCREYDFLGKDEEYKLEWTELVRPHLGLRVYNDSISSQALAMVDKLRQVTRRSSGPLQSNGLAVAMTVVNSAVESGAVMII
jgi:CelD/BcsL family acetyltransferase involved in cellulose biosynthesis